MSPAVGVVLGTRPEIIKLAPVIRALGEQAVCVFTGQHYDAALVDAIFDSCGLPRPHRRLTGVGGTRRTQQIATMISALDVEIRASGVGVVVVQGDTNSANAGAQAAHYLGVPVVHVEAGLRSYDRAMPEEINRMLISTLADVHCAATEDNARNLHGIGVPVAAVHVTGNPVVESTLATLPPPAESARLIDALGLVAEHYVLATFHRPENTDDPARLRAVLDQLGALARPVVLPLHPRTRGCLERAGIAVPEGVRVCPPADYRTFLALAAHAEVIVSDSGGLQEEVTVLKRPMVVVRRSTERPESVRAGFCELAEPDAIRSTVVWMTRPGLRAALAGRPSPYGDGMAGVRIAELARAAAGGHVPAPTFGSARLGAPEPATAVSTVDTVDTVELVPAASGGAG